MANFFVGPVIKRLVDIAFQYLEDQVRWQKGMKEMETLRDNHPRIQSVVDFASSQEMISDQNPALNEWLWQLRDAIEEAEDVLDDLESMKHEKQLTKNKKQRKLRKVRSITKSINKRLAKIAKHALKIDPNLKRLEKVVKKLDKVLIVVVTFLDQVKDAKQEQQLELYACETGSSPNSYLIGRAEDKEYVIKWLRNTSNEYKATFYKNISLLSILGHGGMRKTTLLLVWWDTSGSEAKLSLNALERAYYYFFAKLHKRITFAANI